MAWDDDEVDAADSLKAHESQQPQKPRTFMSAYEVELRDKLAESTMIEMLHDCAIYELDSLDDDGDENDTNIDQVRRIARVSYEMADAMLRARAK